MTTINSDLFERLNLFINDSRKYVKKLSSDTISAQKNVLDFQDEIEHFLDHMYTNFSTNENKNKRLYFPKPIYKESYNDYYCRLAEDKKYKVRSPQLDTFITKSYDIISHYNFAISLIEPMAKHETAHVISSGMVIKNSNKHQDTNKLITYRNDGSIDIGGMMLFKECDNVSVKNISINGTNLSELILNYVNGQHIMFYKNNQEIAHLTFQVWAKSCIRTCQGLMKLYISY